MSLYANKLVTRKTQGVRGAELVAPLPDHGERRRDSEIEFKSPKASDTDNLSYQMNHPEESLNDGVQGASRLANTSMLGGGGNGMLGTTQGQRTFRPSSMNHFIWLFIYILHNKL